MVFAKLKPPRQDLCLAGCTSLTVDPTGLLQATKEKSRLEAVTSSVLADLKASKQPIERAYPAKWFEKVPDAGPKGTKGKFGAIRWQYKGGYWEARESGNFGPTRDVFGNGSTTI